MEKKSPEQCLLISLGKYYYLPKEASAKAVGILVGLLGP